MEEIKAIATIVEDKGPVEAFEIGGKVAKLSLNNCFTFEAEGNVYRIFTKESFESLFGITEYSLDYHPERYGVPNVEYSNVTLRDILFEAIEDSGLVRIGDKVLTIEYL